jgi:hypothetical protein
MAKIKKATDLQQDRRNANRGTMRGEAMVNESFARLGAGRSVLADRNGKLIAGNKSASAFVENGGEDVIVVETDGTKLVVVQRTDLDLDRDPKARELAYVDNRSAEVGLDWNNAVVSEDRDGGDIDLSWMFRSDELGDIIAGGDILPGGDDEEEDRGLGGGMPSDHGSRSGLEIIVLCESESEAKKARREIQELGYYVK